MRKIFPLKYPESFKANFRTSLMSDQQHFRVPCDILLVEAAMFVLIQADQAFETG